MLHLLKSTFSVALTEITETYYSKLLIMVFLFFGSLCFKYILTTKKGILLLSINQSDCSVAMKLTLYWSQTIR